MNRINPIFYIPLLKSMFLLSSKSYQIKNDSLSLDFIQNALVQLEMSTIESIGQIWQIVLSELQDNKSTLSDTISVLWKTSTVDSCNYLIGCFKEINVFDSSDSNFVKSSFILKMFYIFMENKIYIKSYEHLGIIINLILCYSQAIFPQLKTFKDTTAKTINVEILLQIYALFFKNYPKFSEFSLISKLTSINCFEVANMMIKLALGSIIIGINVDLSIFIIENFITQQDFKNLNEIPALLQKYIASIKLSNLKKPDFTILGIIYLNFPKFQDQINNLIPKLQKTDLLSKSIYFGIRGSILSTIQTPSDWIKYCSSFINDIKDIPSLFSDCDEFLVKECRILLRFIKIICKNIPQSNDWPSRNKIRFKLFSYFMYMISAIFDKISPKILDEKHQINSKLFSTMIKCIETMNCLIESPLGNIGAMISFGDPTFVTFVKNLAETVLDLPITQISSYFRFNFSFITFIFYVANYCGGILQLLPNVTVIFLRYLQIPFQIPTQELIDSVCLTLNSFLLYIEQNLLNSHFIMALNSLVNLKDITNAAIFITTFCNRDSTFVIEIASKYAMHFKEKSYQKIVRSVFNHLFEGDEGEVDDDGNLVQFLALEQFVIGMRNIGMPLDAIDDLSPYFEILNIVSQPNQ